MQFHPSDLSLLTVIKASARSYQPQVLAHIAKCGRCQLRLEVLHRLRHPDSIREIGTQTDYDSALDRARQKTQAHLQKLLNEQSSSEILFQTLMKRSHDEQVLTIRSERQFQTWSIFEGLVKRGKRETADNPEKAEGLFLVALELVNRLDNHLYGRERIADLQARSWSLIGNTRRMRLDLTRAEEAFQHSHAYLRKGTGDILERAQVLQLEASLLRTQKQFGSAAKNLQSAVSIYSRIQDDNRIASVLASMSTVRQSSGHIEEALSLLQSASGFIDSTRDPYLSLCLLHNAVNILIDLKRPQQAQAMFLGIHPVYEQVPSLSLLIHRQWTEGRLARALGRHHLAESLLTSARDGFLSKGMFANSTVVAEELRAIQTNG